MDRRYFMSLLAAMMVTTKSFGQAGAAAPAQARNIAQRLAAYAASLRYSDLDERTIEAVKTHLADALGCAVAALGEEPVRIARTVALANASSGGSGGATVLGAPRKTSADLAAFANGAAIRYYDLNDVYAGKEIGHPSDNISACLAVAETQRASGQDLILAIALAYEIDCRLMDAAPISSRGWDHPCYSLPAVALAAGMLMKLPEAKLVEAVNLAISGHLALNQTRVQTMSNWKGLADAEAARNAVFATALAHEGLTGPSPIFEGDAGFFKQVSGPFTIDTGIFGGRGHGFKINDCSVKFYPAQALTQTAIVAAIDVAKQVGDLNRITGIEIRTSHEGYFSAGKDVEKWAPETSETADHSLPYVVGKAMFDGDIDMGSYKQAALHDPKLRAFLKKIKVIDDPALTAIYPKYYAAIVSATLQDGRRVTRRVDDIPGFATRPMQRTDFELKFRKNVKPTMTAGQADDALGLIWTLERQSDIQALFAPFATRA
jgi:2-methylcitrate dehydratase